MYILVITILIFGCCAVVIHQVKELWNAKS